MFGKIIFFQLFLVANQHSLYRCPTERHYYIQCKNVPKDEDIGNKNGTLEMFAMKYNYQRNISFTSNIGSEIEKRTYRRIFCLIRLY